MFDRMRKVGAFVKDKITFFNKKDARLVQGETYLSSDNESYSSNDEGAGYCPNEGHTEHANNSPFQFGSNSGIEARFTFENNSNEDIFSERDKPTGRFKNETSSDVIKTQAFKAKHKKMKVDTFMNRSKRKHNIGLSDSDSDEEGGKDTWKDTSDYFSNVFEPFTEDTNRFARTRSAPSVYQNSCPVVYNIAVVKNSAIGQENTVVNTKIQDCDETTVDSKLQKQVEERTKDLLQSQNVDSIDTEAYMKLKGITKSSPKLAILKGNGGNFYAQKFLRYTCDENAMGDQKCVPYVLREPEEMKVVNMKEYSIVFIPNISGDDQFDSTRYIKWKNLIKTDLLPKLKHLGTLTVVVTIKTFPETFIQLSDLERDNKMGRFVIDIAKIQMNVETRQRLVKHEMKSSGVSLCINRECHTDHRKCISENTINHIVRQTGNLLFAQRVSEYFANYAEHDIEFFKIPPLYFVQIMENLESRESLALLALLAFDGKLSEKDIGWYSNLQFNDKDFRRSIANVSEKQGRVLVLKAVNEFAINNDLHADMWDNIETGLQRLNGTIVKEYDGEYHVDGDALQYAFLLKTSVPLDVVITACDYWFIHNRIISNVTAKDDQHYVHIKRNAEKAKRAVFERLSKALNDQEVQQVWTHSLMEERWFCEGFFKFLKQKTGRLSWYIFKADKTGLLNTILYFGVQRQFRSKGDPANITELVLQHASYGKWRAESRYKKLIASEEREALKHAVKLQRVSTVKRLLSIGVQVHSDLLMNAIETKNVDMVQCLLETQSIQKLETNPFSFKTRCQALSRSLEFYAENKSDENAKQIFQLLTNYGCINYRINNLDPLIIKATKKKDMVMLKLLTEHHLGEDANCQESNVDRGACNGYVMKTVRQTYSSSNTREKVDVNIVTKQGQTALTIAVSDRSYDIIKFLLEKGADQRNLTRRNMELPVMIAIQRNDYSSLQLLIENDPSIVNAMNSHGMTPLHEAVVQDSIDCMNILLFSTELQIDAVNRQNETALHRAVAYGKDRFVDILLKAGADLQMQDIDKNSPLDVATTLGNIYCIELILKASNARKLPSDNRILFTALKGNDQNLLRILFRCGFDINCLSDRFGTPLIMAIENQDYDLMTFLLKHRADPELGRKGFPPVHTVRSRNNIQVLDILLEFGAKLNSTKNDNGNSILHSAVFSNNHELAEDILRRDKNGVLVDMPNRKGDRPLHIACRHGSERCVRVLLRYGATRGVNNAEMMTPQREAETKLTMQRFGKKEQEFKEVLATLMKT